MSNFIFKGKLDKVDTVQKVAYGWAYVSEEGNKEVVDHSGDVWPIAELEKSAHDFVIDCRVGKAMHSGDQKAVLVESIVFTKEKQDALGIDLKKVGWFVGFRIQDEDVLKQIEDGELAMFSIGGSGTREEL
jgi:hypothetical protein